jgi:hypothetical protein
VLIGCYMVAAVMLMVLRHFSDTSQRRNDYGICVYLLLNLLDLAIFWSWNKFIFALRWLALVALYKAMHVGIALHKMRVEKPRGKTIPSTFDLTWFFISYLSPSAFNWAA